MAASSFIVAVIKSENPCFASRSGLEVKPLEVFPLRDSSRVALPAVLPKVHHRPEPLYVATEVNTRQVDGLARIPGLTQAPYRHILFVLGLTFIIFNAPN